MPIFPPNATIPQATSANYPRYRSAREANTFALRSDWIVVGQDIRNAIGEFKKTAAK